MLNQLKSAPNFYRDYFSTATALFTSQPESHFDAIANLILSINAEKRKIIILGNGGSSGIASHFATDFSKCVGIRALALSDASLITCLANDYGHANWMARGLDIHADSGDLLIAISSSGKSENIVNAAKQAKKLGMPVVTLTGFLADNPLRSIGDTNLWVDSNCYNIIESAHHFWMGMIVDRVFAALN